MILNLKILKFIIPSIINFLIHNEWIIIKNKNARESYSEKANLNKKIGRAIKVC